MGRKEQEIAIDIKGLKLPAKAARQLNQELQLTTLREIARLDLVKDIRINVEDGLINGIIIRQL